MHCLVLSRGEEKKEVRKIPLKCDEKDTLQKDPNNNNNSKNNINTDHYNIAQWCIQCTSLENTMMNIVRKNDKRKTAIPNCFPTYNRRIDAVLQTVLEGTSGTSCMLDDDSISCKSE
jgi:hypothetical protein